jgi:hypothetical protein
MKFEYDLTLEGDSLYYENIHRWTDFLRSLGLPCFVCCNEKTREVEKITFEAPTREDLEIIKKIDKILEGN